MLLKKILLSILCVLVIFTVGPQAAFADELIPPAEQTDNVLTSTDTETVSTETDSGTDPDTPSDTGNTETGSDSESETTIDNETGTETGTETDEDLEEEAGITPDSWLYSIEQMIESVQLAVTFSAEGKAELLIEFADERLAEAQIMAEKEQQELVRKVIQAYTQTIKQANFQVQQVIEEQQGTTENNGNTAEELTEVTEEVIAQTEEQTKRINSIIEKVEVVQSDAGKIVVKLSAYLPKEQAEQIQAVIKAEVQNTIAQKAYVAVKKNFVESAKLYAQAKNELALAKNSGDEAAIQAAMEKVRLAEQYKKDLKEVTKDVHDLQKEVKKDNKEIVKEARKEIKETIKKQRKANRNGENKQGEESGAVEEEQTGDDEDADDADGQEVIAEDDGQSEENAQEESAEDQSAQTDDQQTASQSALMVNNQTAGQAGSADSGKGNDRSQGGKEGGQRKGR